MGNYSNKLYLKFIRIEKIYLIVKVSMFGKLVYHRMGERLSIMGMVFHV